MHSHNPLNHFFVQENLYKKNERKTLAYLDKKGFVIDIMKYERVQAVIRILYIFKPKKIINNLLLSKEKRRFNHFFLELYFIQILS